MKLGDLGFGDYYSAEDIKGILHDYLTSKDVGSEYKEILYEIILTFINKDAVTNYFFQKKKKGEEFCYPCTNQSCRCSCLTLGRVRRLQIIDPPPHDRLKGFGLCKVSEDAQDDIFGSIKLLEQNKEPFEFYTKLKWVWCHNSIKIGEFSDGPRESEALLKFWEEVVPSPIAEILRSG